MTLAAIARRELGALFRSPVAWAVLAIVQVLVAFVFVFHLGATSRPRRSSRRAAAGPA